MTRDSKSHSHTPTHCYITEDIAIMIIEMTCCYQLHARDSICQYVGQLFGWSVGWLVGQLVGLSDAWSHLLAHSLVRSLPLSRPSSWEMS